MRNIETIKNRVLIQQMGEDGGFARIQHPAGKGTMLAIFSWGEGWEHVSVSYNGKCPTWDEMCYVKNIFWNEDECVVQYHPAKKDYVNLHPYCLHLWKPIGIDIPKPPKELVF